MNNKLIIGTSTFCNDYGEFNHKGISIKQIFEIVSLLERFNIYSYDTAPIYGNSEKALGKVKFSSPINIYTKLQKLDFNNHQINENDIKKIKKTFEESLNKLNTVKVEGLLVHQIDDFKKKNSDLLYNYLIDLKKKGIVNKIGISVYNIEEIFEIFNRYTFDFIQFPLNVFDQRFLDDRLLKLKHNNKVELHCRSIFLQGSLLQPSMKLSKHLSNFRNQFQILENYICDKKISNIDFLCDFIKQQKFIDKVIIGFNSIQQLKQILNSFLKTNLVKNIDYKKFSCENLKIIDPRYWNN